MIYKELLSKTATLASKYHQVNEVPGDYNLIKIFFNGTEEVSLHTKFIYDLINPDGTHAMGDIFLNKFIRILGGDVDGFNADNCKVLREDSKIDILIKTDCAAIIIENKPNWGDQPKQIERYYKKVIDQGIAAENIRIIYLTRDGRAPSENSRGTIPLHKIKTCSYEKEILEWIDACLEEVDQNTFIHVALLQYREIVEELTGKIKLETLTMDLVNMLREDADKFSAALSLNQVVNQAKIEVQLEFWGKLERSLARKELETHANPDVYFSRQKVTAFYEGNRNTIWYGISIPMESFASVNEIAYRIEIDHEGKVWHGFWYNHDNVQDPKDIGDLKEKVKELTPDLDSGDWWLTNEKLDIDFRDFNSETTRALIESGDIENYTRELANKIANDIQKYQHHTINIAA